ncbi:TIMELESS-interacting protein [Lampris incognitus]|uniref:TIMELESS-interacting protein n=1 Tax=Lampris incognitus TaxID=2546036 RepID=UPI0024B5A173|nr:TIMELESS-interacting protein [Lampris incognitus]
MFDPEENAMIDFPDYEQIVDETFPPLPPPHSPGQAGAAAGEEGDSFANGEDEGEVSKLPDVPSAKRRGVKRPQPKLDSQRLTSERGLPALRSLFDDVHFKGKGHEAENLRLLMQRLENWAHRLYPKLQFEEFIEKVEKLGSKKDVQTCLKRIRLDMPLTFDDFVGKDGAEETENQQVFGDVPEVEAPVFPDDPTGPLHSTPAPHLPTSPPPTLTEEQLRRMELNKKLAMERRLARTQQDGVLSDSQPFSSPEPRTSPSLPRPQEEEGGLDLHQENHDEEEQSHQDPQTGSPQQEEDETHDRDED